MKILNLYAGIGGNRKLWGDEHEVVAVENNEDIAKVYQKLFPKDKVIVGDAHKFLLEHYKEFDFIWSSPPCPTHSRINFSNGGRWKVKYPDMKLYGEIILLKHWFKGKWVVENVKSYYEPLIKPQESGRHYFWSNFKIDNKKYSLHIGAMNKGGHRRRTIREAQIPELIDLHGFKDFSISNKRQVLRNCVLPELGLHIFKCAFKDKQNTL
ncbi:hypothetical protein LCGC14_0912350 [marine sediment metagenome]|uniref:DNA (cytosine-5-)-methyltransferase n=1 Tax=marine sediment metagenome TaxID=412755 RepID=A0A0F9S028_9ZZZZ